MKLAGFTVRRPVFTSMATLIVMILGGIALWRLPVDLMPDVTYPTLSVSTSYANTSPEEMEELVTRPLEEALSAVPGVEEIISTSSEGASSLRISFAWGTDLDVAANDIRDRLDRAIARLPDDVDRPMLRKFDLASFPVMILGAAGEFDPIELRRLVEDQVKFRLERVPGVASLDIWGGLEREIQVDLDLDRVRAYNLSLSQVLARIRQGNVEKPAGTVRQGHLDLRVRVPGYFQSVEELRDTIVMEQAGVAVRLQDVASVVDAWEKPTRLVRVNGRPGLRLALNKQSGANTVAVAREALRELERINLELPHLEISPIIDSSMYIRRSLKNLGMAAGFGGLLAVLVLLVFLRDFRSTLVIAVAIPVSVVATFAMIYFNGYTLNIMTLGGLALGVGMLVD
ncbi:MAG: efflux RND transporter permease subunit, partial [Kiritimatiellia bacterium]